MIWPAQQIQWSGLILMFGWRFRPAMVSELLFDALLPTKQWNFEEISKLSSTSTMIVAWAAPVWSL
jgi:hypothetical protein